MGCKSPRAGHCEASPFVRISQIHGSLAIIPPKPEQCSFRPHRVSGEVSYCSTVLRRGTFSFVFPPAPVGRRWETRYTLPVLFGSMNAKSASRSQDRLDALWRFWNSFSANLNNPRYKERRFISGGFRRKITLAVSGKICYNIKSSFIPMPCAGSYGAEQRSLSEGM